MEENESHSPKINVRPEILAATGLGLSVVLVLLLSSRLRKVERENNLLRQNYQGAVEVVNHRVPCPCQQTNGKMAPPVATPQEYQTVPGSAQLPPDLPVEEGRS